MGVVAASWIGVETAAARRKKKRKKGCQDGESACAAACCPAGAQCIGDACCPADLACGSVCCTLNEICTDGTCRVSCPGHPACDEPPAAPSGLKAEPLSQTRIRLSWDRVIGDDGLTVHDETRQIAALAAGATSHVVEGLEPDSYRCFLVKAYNANGGSDWSDWACTETDRCMHRSPECSSGEACGFGCLADGICWQVPLPCRIRTVVVVPSDVDALPSDEGVARAVDAALSRIGDFYRNTASVELRFEPATVTRSKYDTRWFSTPVTSSARGKPARRHGVPAPVACDLRTAAVHRVIDDIGASPGIDWERLWQFLGDVGYGHCADGLITIAVVASSAGGGSVGGARCGGAVLQTDGSGPDDGPGKSGLAMVGQWVLDAMLGDDLSSSCTREMGANHWACASSVSLGTLAHELGHALGLPHPCLGWHSENWDFSRRECAGLVMHAHWNFPEVGFSDQEIALLQLSQIESR